jgi:transcriptional regulator with XRE-family HTH domain
MHYKTLALKTRKDKDTSQRIRQYGPIPSNPFAVLRTDRELSLGQLASYTRTNIMALSRSESGLYTNPLPALVNYWVGRGDISEGDLIEQYADYQFLQRKRHSRFLGSPLDRSASYTLHPFRFLRANYHSLDDGQILPLGLTETAQALCVPLDTIQFWEKNFKIQQTVPKTVKAALLDCDYNQQEITNLEALYKFWRNHTNLDLVMS